ncbi:hypothetical protein J4Q44_G00039880 [Coregonus suidteri]|uniref:C2H2-type domain-containing protein n=1 Tax=Coregonus suidteri TaxID=861788 RepID=A0AAN8NCG3_9TELE
MSGSVVDFQAQIASIMEVLANAAVTEICKVVDDGYAVVHMEMSQSHKENEFLRRKMKLMELQIARFRAERTKFSEGSVHNRFHGIRLLNRHNNRETATTGPTWQSRARLSNRSFGNSSIQRDRQPIDVDQEDVSPSKHMDATSDEQSAETEDGEPDLLIIKDDGEADDQDSRTSHPARTVEGSREPTTQPDAATTVDTALQPSGPRGNNYINTAMEQSGETEDGEPDLLIIKVEGEADDQDSRSSHPARTVEGSRELTTQPAAATTEDPAFQSSGPKGNNYNNNTTTMEVSGSYAVVLQSETGTVNQGTQQHTGIELRAERQSLDTKCDMNRDLTLLRDSLNQVWREVVVTDDGASAAHTKVMDLGSGPVGPEMQTSSAIEMRSVGLENHRFHSSSEHVIVIDSVSSGQQVDRDFEWGQVGTATTPQVNGTGNKQGVGVFNRNAPMIHLDSMRDNTTLLVAPAFHPTEKNTGTRPDTGNAGNTWQSRARLSNRSFGNSSIQRDRQPIDVDQEDVSPSKHMDATSDEQSAETEEGEPDLLIIKEEGEADDQDSRSSHPARTVEGSRELTTQPAAATTEDPAFQPSGPRGNNYNNTAMEQSGETVGGEPDLLIIKVEGEADDQDSRSSHPARTVEGSRELTTQPAAATTEDPAFQPSGPRGNNNNYNDTAMEVSGSDAILLQSETRNVNQGPQQHTGFEPRAERQSLDTKCDVNGGLNLLRDSLNQVWREVVVTDDGASAAHTKIARFRAERTKFSEGSVHNRFHGIRLLNRHNNRETATTGPTWQSRARLSNRSFGNSSIQRDRQPIDVDQEDVSPSKHMDATSDEQSGETEEGEPDLLIIKEEGEADDQDSRSSHPARTVEGSRELTTQPAAATTEDPAVQSSGPKGNNNNIHTAMEAKSTVEGERDLQPWKNEEDLREMPGTDSGQRIPGPDSQTSPDTDQAELTEQLRTKHIIVNVNRSDTEPESLSQVLQLTGPGPVAKQQRSLNPARTTDLPVNSCKRRGSDTANDWPSCSSYAAETVSGSPSPLTKVNPIPPLPQMVRGEHENSQGGSEVKSEVIVIDPLPVDEGEGGDDTPSSWRQGVQAAARQNSPENLFYTIGMDGAFDNRLGTFQNPATTATAPFAEGTGELQYPSWVDFPGSAPDTHLGDMTGTHQDRGVQKAQEGELSGSTLPLKVKVGDWVRVKVHKRKWLEPRWTGPYEVKEVTSHSVQVRGLRKDLVEEQEDEEEASGADMKDDPMDHNDPTDHDDYTLLLPMSSQGPSQPVKPKTSSEGPSQPVKPKTTSSLVKLTEDKLHVTVLEGTSLPPLQRCTTCCSYYHCPYCTFFKPARRTKTIQHIRCHLARAVCHKGYTMIRCESSAEDDDNTAAEEEGLSQPTNNELPVTVLKGQTMPPLQRCTTCCRKYHCPFCTAFKPNRKCHLLMHLDTHISRAVFHDGYVIMTCTSNCRKDGHRHHHCPYCKETQRSRHHLISHLRTCRRRNPGGTNTGDVDAASLEATIAFEGITEDDATAALQIEATASVLTYNLTRNQRIEITPQSQTSQSPAYRPLTTVCDHCGFVLLRKNLKQHMLRKHPEIATPWEGVDPVSVAQQHGAMKHAEGTRRRLTATCTVCGRTVTMKNMRAHMNRKHPDSW